MSFCKEFFTTDNQNQNEWNVSVFATKITDWAKSWNEMVRHFGDDRHWLHYELFRQIMVFNFKGEGLKLKFTFYTAHKIKII